MCLKYRLPVGADLAKSDALAFVELNGPGKRAGTQFLIGAAWVFKASAAWVEFLLLDFCVKALP